MMKTAFLACTALMCGASHAFMVSTPRSAPNKATMTMRASRDDVSRQDVLTAAGALGAALGLSSVVLAPGAALADTTLAQRKVQYFRYAPRIVSGAEYLAEDLKKAIESKDWKAIAAAFNLQKVAAEGSMRNNPRASETRFERDLFDPMKLLAQTTAERGVSKRLTTLLEAEAKLEKALGRLAKVSTGDLSPVRFDEPGFLFGLIGGKRDDSPDPYAGKNQAQIAQAAYNDARDAYNAYASTFNNGLSLSLNPLPII